MEEHRNDSRGISLGSINSPVMKRVKNDTMIAWYTGAILTLDIASSPDVESKAEAKGCS
jgi:hypothetical protein